MKSSQLTFGIEIECYISLAHFSQAEVGQYHSGNEIAGFPKGWNAQTDGSIRPYAPFGFVGVEIVSPVLKGKKGLTEVVAVVDWLNSVGAKVSKSPRRFAPRPMNLGEFISNVVSKFSPMDLGGDYGKFEELVSQSMMF